MQKRKGIAGNKLCNEEESSASVSLSGRDQ